MSESGMLAGKYKHYKNGKIYEVIDQALHSETLEKLIVYRVSGDHQLWVRPAQMFFEQVIYNGQEVLRFQRIE